MSHTSELSEGANEPDTLLSLVLRQCNRHREKAALHWLNDECEVVDRITYGELASRTLRLAVGLLERATGFARGERAVLCYSPRLEFIEAFLACIRAGVIAVPVSPPGPHDTPENLLGILADCEAACVLTNDQMMQETMPPVMEELRQRGGIPWYSTTTILANEAHGSPQPLRATAMMLDAGGTADRPTGNEIYCGSDGATDLDNSQPGDVPMLLYSLGPTGSPIGIMPTHADILHNLRIMEAEMRADSSMVEVSFLPHFHTMGLLASYLQTICAGGTGYFMPHLAFEGNPGLWIQALSKFKGTHSKVPRFGFEHLLCKGIPTGANLSSVRSIMNAAEIARPETILHVQQVLKPHGLKEGAIQVGFGFLGHALYVCSSQQPPLVCLDGSVCCGQPAAGITVKIVNPESRTEVPEERIGEIWVHSYISMPTTPKNKAQTLHATICGDSERAYLCTGVLGSMSAGNLFVCGQIADAINLQDGRVFPANIEALVETEITALRMERSVAFSYSQATPTNAEGAADIASPPPAELHLQSEGIGYVAELRAPDQHTLIELEQLAEDISSLITRKFQVSTMTIAFAKPGALPYTWSTSGHRQRALVKEQLCKGSLGEIYRWTPHGIHAMESNGARTQPEYEVALPNPTAIGGTSLDMAKITDEPVDHDAVISKREVSPEIAKPKGKKHRSMSCVEHSAAQVHSKKSRRATSLSSQFRASETLKHSRPEGNSTSYDRNIEWITCIIGKVLGVKLQPDSNIWACGCTSLLGAEISQRLQRELGFAVQPHVLFTHQTPKTLLTKLKSNLLGTSSPEKVTNGAQVAELTTTCNDSDVAIIGMACSLASCKDTAELWEMMLRKEVVTTSIQLPYSDQTIFGAFTDDMGRFDYKFFGISKWEASTIDPQQSILLHVTWDCLQNAGYGSSGSLEAIKGTDIGVFVGATSSDARVLGQSTKPLPPGTSFVGAITANRISYFFDFKGPSVTVDTACGASLSALQVACNSLKLGECSAALVGGVNAMVDPNGFLFLANMGMLSPDGKSKVFDAGANGYLRGEGCGVVFLKRVIDADRDGDRILAVIKSVVTNHNGTSATPTSPNCLSQQNLLRQSLKSARLTPHHICYVEAHGSGTKLGDPIELDAITETFCQSHLLSEGKNKMTRSSPIAVGSVKANIGHLEQGAGIAGLIKTVMVLEHARAPGNACLEEVNPAFTLDSTQIVIPKEDVSLEDCHFEYIGENHSETTQPRLLAAAVNSFGFGGTNVNAILQQYTTLPHLGRTKLAIVLDCGSLEGESAASPLLLESIHYLCLKLQIFSECYTRCMEALNRTATKLKNLDRASLLKNHVILSFCLLYGMAETIRAQNVEINLVGGTGMSAELAALVLSNALTLCDAFQLLLVHLYPASPNLTAKTAVVGCKLFRSAIPFLSQVTGRLYQPREIPKAYLTHLLPTEGAMEFPERVTAEQNKAISSTLRGHKPLLWISLLAEEFAPVKEGNDSIVIQVCRNRYLMQEIREKLLEVRQQSDDVALDMCSNRPSRHIPMPKFYDRYPLRALVDGVTISQDTIPEYHDHGLGSAFFATRMPTHRRTNRRHFSRYSIDSGSSYDFDPGYITQTTSGESLEPLTPLSSPRKLEPTAARANERPQSSQWSPVSMTRMEKTMKKCEPAVATPVSREQANILVKKLINGEGTEDTETALPGISPRLTTKAEFDTSSPVYKEMKAEVLRELQEEIQEDLDDPDIPLEEMASSGIFQLGLDSLSIMQISSFIMTSYEVSKSFSELANCGTLGGIADMVLQKCPKFSGKLPLKAEERDSRYPSLTKEGYYTIPSLARLSALPVEQLTCVENFTVARKGRGKIMFLGKTNITSLKLDTLVEIETLYAEVRSRVEQPTSSNLNRPALVLFENVHPQGNTEADYAAMLGALTEVCRNQEMGAEIMEYDGRLGKVVVKVDRFY